MKKIILIALVASLNIYAQSERLPEIPIQDLSKESEKVVLSKITAFPEHIFKWNIKTLVLSECDDMNSIPKEISKFKNLELFMLTGGHKIIDFPKEFASLNSLKQLSLHNMRTAKISPVLFDLKSLEIFEYLQFSYFEFPEEISKLKTLKKLGISRGLDSRSLKNVEGKAGRNLPTSIKKLENIESLSLGGNLMSELPEEIGFLKNLDDCWLSNNVLETLPNGFSKLQKLKTLHLDNNVFKVFPKALFKVASLKRLDIYKNQISRIPAGISGMTNLTGLFIDNNQLTNECLSELYNLENLEVLDIRNNKITSFPAGLEKMKKLKVMYIAGNSISDQEVVRAQSLLPTAKFVTQEMPQ